MTSANSTTSQRSATESRAIALLGQGLGAETVAATVGVSVSRISQLISDPVFMEEVASLRFKNLQKHNDRDSAYDSMEDTLVEKLRDLLPMMFRPMEVLKAISVINAAKRRGHSNPDMVLNQQTVVSINLPKQLINKYTVNVNNQVISAGDQELLTMQSGSLQSMISARKVSQSTPHPIEEYCDESISTGNGSLVTSSDSP